MKRSEKIALLGIILAALGTLLQLLEFLDIKFFKSLDITFIYLSLKYILVLGGISLIFITVLIVKTHKYLIKREKFSFKSAASYWGPYILILILLIFLIPVINEIINVRQNIMFEGLAEEQISWLLNNKVISFELSNDIYHLNSYIKRVAEFKSPYIEKISKILRETIDVLSGAEENPYEIIYKNYCKKDENSGLEPQEDLNSKKLKKDYAYYLSLKGLIAKETCYEGSNKERFNIAEKYFDRALNYYEKCPIAFNGKGVILLYRLRQENNLSPYSVKLARQSIEKFEKTEEVAEFKSIFIRGRRLNNIVCTDLNTLNKIYISGKLKHINPKLKEFYDELPLAEQKYFRPFVDDFENKFETNWETLTEARKNISSAPQLHLTIAEFYCITAEYLLNYYKEDSREYKNFCTRVFGKYGPVNPRKLLEEALKLINTATDLGYADFKKFMTKDDESIRRYGYGGFLSAREKNMNDLYEKFLDITGIYK